MTKYSFTGFSVVSFATTGMGTNVMSTTTAMQTRFKFFNSITLTPLLYSFTLSQAGHNGSGQSKLALSAGELAQRLIVAQCIYMHGGLATTIFNIVTVTPKPLPLPAPPAYIYTATVKTFVI